MVSKSCSNILPELLITELNCGCSDSTSRYKRIAKNAILPFYYDCTGVTNSYNLENVERCRKYREILEQYWNKNPLLREKQQKIDDFF